MLFGLKPRGKHFPMRRLDEKKIPQSISRGLATLYHGRAKGCG
jgi:hypothetical protein